MQAIHRKQGNSNFHTIIDDCIVLLKHFREVLVVFEYPSANVVAYLLAWAAGFMSGLKKWHTILLLSWSNVILSLKRINESKFLLSKKKKKRNKTNVAVYQFKLETTPFEKKNFFFYFCYFLPFFSYSKFTYLSFANNLCAEQFVLGKCTMKNCYIQIYIITSYMK